MEKLNDYLERFDQSTQNDNRYLLRQLRERRDLLVSCYYDFTMVLNALAGIEKRDTYFQDDYDNLKNTGLDRFLDTLDARSDEFTTDDILERFKHFLSPQYMTITAPLIILGELEGLLSCFDYLVKRRIKTLPLSVVLALDMATMDLLNNAAGAKNTAFMTGLKRDNNKRAAIPQVKTKRKNRNSKKPGILAALTEVLSEEKRISQKYENEVLELIRKKPGAIYAIETIKSIVREHYKELGEKPLWKQMKRKSKKSH